MSDLTELQREILLTARDYPRATQSEIAERCDCSPSYVSNVLNRFDSVDAFHAEIDGLAGVDPMAADFDFNQQPAWMEGVEPAADQEEFDQAVADGLNILGQSLKRGFKGLKVLIRKFRN